MGSTLFAAGFNSLFAVGLSASLQAMDLSGSARFLLESVD